MRFSGRAEGGGGGKEEGEREIDRKREEIHL
jgi:hypothetical protein